MRWLLRVMEWLAVAGAVVVGVVLLAAVIRIVWASARLERKITTLHQAGEPATLSDLTREPIPAHTNAATYLGMARGDVESIQNKMLVVDAEMDKVGFYEGGTSAAIEATIRDALAAHPGAVPLLIEASNCLDYDPPLNFSADQQTFNKDLIDHLQYTRAATRVLNFQARLQLAEGHAEDALYTCRAMFRLARHFDCHPTLVGQLVSIAVRGTAVATANLVLHAGPFDDSAHRDLETELARHDMAEAYRQGLRSERAFGLLAFQDTAREMGIGARWFPSFNNDMCDYLDVMAEYIQCADDCYADSAGRIRAAFVPEKLSTLTRQVLPAMQAQHAAFARVRAELGSLRVLNAVVCREKTQGSSTVKLDKLGLPEDAITDPYTGDPLHVKKLAGGWLVYSVGNNLTDDGGKLRDQEDVGLGPSEQPETERPDDASKQPP